jgi:hypothetical protein
MIVQRFLCLLTPQNGWLDRDSIKYTENQVPSPSLRQVGAAQHILSQMMTAKNLVTFMAMGENVVIAFSDTMTLNMHSGNDKSHLAPDYKRYSGSSAPPRSVRHSIKWFCTIINILICNSWFKMKSAESKRGYELSLNDLPGANPFGLSSASGCSRVRWRPCNHRW